MTTPGLTNRPTGGDPAAYRQLCARDAVEPGLSIATASETAALGRTLIRMPMRALIRTSMRALIRTLIGTLIPGASRLPLASNAIARDASLGLRAIPHCSCLLMRPRAGPALRRQLDLRELDLRELDRRRLRLRSREPGKASPSKQKKNPRPPELPASPDLAQPRSQPRRHPRSPPPRSSSSHVPPQFRSFTRATWPIPSLIVIVRASSKPRRFSRRLPHWVEC